MRALCPPPRTDRLSFREMREADVDFVLSMVGDPRVMRHYPSVLDRAGATAWVDKQTARYARDGHGLWIVTLRETGEAIGQIGLMIQEVDGVREPEIGYLLHPASQGRGFATEAAAAIRDFALGRLGFDHVISLIRPANEPSRRVAGRLGMGMAKRTLFHGLEHDVWRVDAGR